ncbi:MAG: hypothetical protein ACXW2X_06185 [Thermoanaerobaculia bacterium]
MKKTTLVLLLLAPTSFAQQPPREIFPSDYKPSPCAPTEVCQSFTNINFESAAASFLMRTLDSKWSDEHRDDLKRMIPPYCLKRATCMGSPGRQRWFCNEVFAQELRLGCDAEFDGKTQAHDNEQCHTWVDVFSAGVDPRGSADWKVAQQCAKEKAGAQSAPRRMEWWMVPATIPLDYKGYLRLYAIDAETHIPVPTQVEFEGQTVYATSTPTGKPTAYYPFQWPRLLARAPNAQGHTDVIPTMMTLTAEGYETIKVRVPTPVPQMTVTMSPSKLHAGTNIITVTATDAATGKPVEGQVYAGEETIGFTNQPIEIKAGKGRKRPEIWVRSPFDVYSDVVAAPAVK